MGRTARIAPGGVCYHVMSRGNKRETVFHTAADYDDFVWLMASACERIPMRLLAYCLMPNHFHFVLWPHGTGDMSQWMHWLLTSHVVRYHKKRGTSGRVWQGRYKSFPIEEDRHLLTVLRYVERNPVRANLVSRAVDWNWSSAFGHSGPDIRTTEGPMPKPENWAEFVDQPQTEEELESLRRCSFKCMPFGSPDWTRETAINLGLNSSLRGPGRPKK